MMTWEWVGMGMGVMLWEWEGAGTLKLIPAHLYRETPSTELHCSCSRNKQVTTLR